MKHLRLSAGLLLCALFGCLVVPIPRNPFPLDSDSRPKAPTALLPVLPAQIATCHEYWKNGIYAHDGDAEKEKKSIANRVNAVLETLVGSKDHALAGPRQVADSLKHTPGWEKALERLDSTTNPDELTRAMLAAMAQRLGSFRVVYLKRILVQEKKYFEGAGPPWGPPIPTVLWDLWKGTITVTAEEIDLNAGRVVSSKTNQGSYWGYLGNPVCVAGAIIWKTEGRGLDEAIRAALTDLFKQEGPIGRKG
jgi:hypothetical protein